MMDDKEFTVPVEDEDPNLSVEMARALLEASVVRKEDEVDDDVQSQIKRVLEPARAVQKPNVDNLDDAVVEVEGHGTVFLPQAGEGLIIQYPQSYRDTTYYTIDSIDYETGMVWLWNPQRKQWACSNFKDAQKAGLVMKTPPEGASELRMALVLGQRKRGRPRKNPIDQIVAPVEKSGRGRGRPKGTKNRPKDVILEEKKQRREEKQAKAEARSMRSHRRMR